MTRAVFGRSARRNFRSGLVAAVALLGMLLVAPAPAPADPGQGQTTETTVHVPGMLVDNRCNGEPVGLNGDLHITTTTTPLAGGGYTVRASAISEGLSGTGLVTGLAYTAQDDEFSFAYYAPPPRSSSFIDVHFTKLTPEGGGRTMYLVMVLRARTSADGTTVPTLDRTFVVCARR